MELHTDRESFLHIVRTPVDQNHTHGCHQLDNNKALVSRVAQDHIENDVLIPVPLTYEEIINNIEDNENVKSLNFIMCRFAFTD